MHPYLSDAACVYRLVDEYKRYGSIVVAYDFDNCVYDYHKKGHDYSEVINLIKEAKNLGCRLTVFTANDNISSVLHYLTEANIPFDDINDNPPFFKSTARKVFYSILLDDRAGLSAACNQLKEFIHIIKNKI